MWKRHAIMLGKSDSLKKNEDKKWGEVDRKKVVFEINSIK